MRAKYKLLQRPVLEQGFDAADTFKHGHVEPHRALLQCGHGHGTTCIEHHDTRLWLALQGCGERLQIHRRGTQQRMLGALVFHLRDDLHQQLVPGGSFKKLGEKRVIERVTMVVGKQADGLHAMVFGAARDVVLPVRQPEIDGAHGTDQTV